MAVLFHCRKSHINIPKHWRQNKMDNMMWLSIYFNRFCNMMKLHRFVFTYSFKVFFSFITHTRTHCEPLSPLPGFSVSIYFSFDCLFICCVLQNDAQKIFSCSLFIIYFLLHANTRRLKLIQWQYMSNFDWNIVAAKIWPKCTMHKNRIVWHWKCFYRYVVLKSNQILFRIFIIFFCLLRGVAHVL